jgi:hypothetical protein
MKSTILGAAASMLLLSPGEAAAGGADAARLTEADLANWLARYESAWETRDPDAAASLFTAGATYHEMPFDAPIAGQDGIRAYWARVTADQRDVDFQSKPIAVSGRTGVAEWRATFRLASSDATIDLDGAFVLTFDDEGRCTSLREWWHVRQR